jgi:hypothetical protein
MSRVDKAIIATLVLICCLLILCCAGIGDEMGLF